MYALYNFFIDHSMELGSQLLKKYNGYKMQGMQ